MILIAIFFALIMGSNWLMQHNQQVVMKQRWIVLLISAFFFLLAEVFFFFQEKWTIPMLLRMASQSIKKLIF